MKKANNETAIIWKANSTAWAMAEKIIKDCRTGCLYLDGTTAIVTNGKHLLIVADAATAPGNGAYTYAKEGKHIVLNYADGHNMIKYKQVIPDTAKWHCCQLDFSEDRPLYPELFKMMAALAKNGGYRAGDKTTDLVIDTFGAFNMRYSDTPKAPLVFDGDGYTLIAGPCTGLAESVQDEINSLIAAAAPAKAPAATPEPAKKEKKAPAKAKAA